MQEQASLGWHGGVIVVVGGSVVGGGGVDVFGSGVSVVHIALFAVNLFVVVNFAF